MPVFEAEDVTSKGEDEVARLASSAWRINKSFTASVAVRQTLVLLLGSLAYNAGSILCVAVWPSVAGVRGTRSLTQLLVWPPILYRFAFSGNGYITAASLLFVLGSALYVCALGLDLQEMAQAKEKVGRAPNPQEEKTDSAYLTASPLPGTSSGDGRGCIPHKTQFPAQVGGAGAQHQWRRRVGAWLWHMQLSSAPSPLTPALRSLLRLRITWSHA
jgi:hypothetical protein